MALLAIVESDHTLFKKSDSKRQMEFKRLTWSLNYEGSASTTRSKGKRLPVS